jgi:hypothetical protein
VSAVWPLRCSLARWLYRKTATLWAAQDRSRRGWVAYVLAVSCARASFGVVPAGQLWDRAAEEVADG